MTDCPNEETWLAFLERSQREQTSPPSRVDPREVDAHLATCSDCRALVTLLAEQASHVTVAANDERTSTTDNAEIGHAVDELRALVVSHDDKRVGTIVADKWEVEALLGAGGMGRVYRARHRNGHRVAIKFLHPSLAAGNPSVVRRFRREGYVANRVGHPGIVQVLDDGDDDGPYLVMELLDGMSCRAKLSASGSFAVEDALAVVEAAADALAAAHRAGVVHRDVKPDNIFLTNDGKTRLLDFGLASIRHALSAESGSIDGVTVGTVGFMSPEQARGDNAAVTPRSDVWSLAATCVTLLTGRSVHDGKTPAEQLAFAVTKPARAVRSLGVEVPRSVADVLDRALSFEPDDRPEDAAAFLDDLRRARTEKRSRRPLVTMTAALLAAATTVAIVSRRPHEVPEATTVTPLAPSPIDVRASELPAPTTSLTTSATALETLPAPTLVPGVTTASSVRPSRRAVPPPRASTPAPPAATPVTASAPPSPPATTRDPLSPRF